MAGRKHDFFWLEGSSFSDSENGEAAVFEQISLFIWPTCLPERESKARNDSSPIQQVLNGTVSYGGVIPVRTIHGGSAGRPVINHPKESEELDVSAKENPLGESSIGLGGAEVAIFEKMSELETLNFFVDDESNARDDASHSREVDVRVDLTGSGILITVYPDERNEFILEKSIDLKNWARVSSGAVIDSDSGRWKYRIVGEPARKEEYYRVRYLMR